MRKKYKLDLLSKNENKWWRGAQNNKRKQMVAKGTK
jgi:hypothetical protein